MSLSIAKKMFKCWWDGKLRSLKAASVDANKVWKAAGKPRHDSVYSARQSSRKRYRARLRDKQAMESQSYINDHIKKWCHFLEVLAV